MLTLGAGADDPVLVTPKLKPPAPSSTLGALDKIPPAASMVLPAAVTVLVDRQKHPIVWWVFGVIPLAGGAARAIMQRRLF